MSALPTPTLRSPVALRLAAGCFLAASIGGCEPEASECTDETDCPDGEICGKAGGVLVTGGRCVPPDFLPTSDGTDGTEDSDASAPSPGPRSVQFGTPKADRVSAIAVDPRTDSRIFVLGNTDGSLNVGEGFSASGGYLLKWTAQSGADRVFELPDADRVADFSFDPKDREAAYIVGSSAEGSSGGYVAKYDLADPDAPSPIWVRTVADARSCKAVVPRDNDVVVACTLPSKMNDGGTRATVVRFDPDGSNEVFYRADASSESYARGLDIDDTGAVFVGGYGDAIGAAGTARDAFVTRLSPTGTEDWTYVSDWNGNERAVSLEVLPTNAAMFGGRGDPPGPDIPEGALIQHCSPDLDKPCEDPPDWFQSRDTRELYRSLATVAPGKKKVFAASEAVIETFTDEGLTEEPRQLFEQLDEPVNDVVSLRDLEVHPSSNRIYLVGNTEVALPDSSHAGDLDGFLHSIPLP